MIVTKETSKTSFKLGKSFAYIEYFKCKKKGTKKVIPEKALV